MDATALIIFTQLVIESLPVSSSTHLILLSTFLVDAPYLPEEFDHFLHGPTALVIALFFFHQWKDKVWWFLPKNLMWKKTHKRHATKLNSFAIKIFTFAFVANVLTGLLYFLIKLLKKRVDFISSNTALVTGLVVTCTLLLSLRKAEKDYKPLTLGGAALLGMVQGLALLPGISRFASTYVVGRFLGLSPRRAFQITFLIQFPTCIAAFLKGGWDLIKTPGWEQIFTTPVLFSFVFGTGGALVGLWFAQVLAMRYKFWWFGLYMPVPILLVVLRLLNH